MQRRLVELKVSVSEKIRSTATPLYQVPLGITSHTNYILPQSEPTCRKFQRIGGFFDDGRRMEVETLNPTKEIPIGRGRADGCQSQRGCQGQAEGKAARLAWKKGAMPRTGGESGFYSFFLSFSPLCAWGKGYMKVHFYSLCHNVTQKIENSYTIVPAPLGIEPQYYYTTSKHTLPWTGMEAELALGFCRL